MPLILLVRDAAPVLVHDVTDGEPPPGGASSSAPARLVVAPVAVVVWR